MKNPFLSNLKTDVASYVRELRAERTALNEGRQKIAEEIDALETAPLAKEDVLQFIGDYIDRRAADYPKNEGNWRKLLESVIYPDRYPGRGFTARPGIGQPEPLSLRDVDAALTGSHSEKHAVFGSDGLKFYTSAIVANAASDLSAFFFFGDVIKAKLAQHFDEFFPGYLDIDARRIGPPLAKRRDLIAKLRSNVDGVDARIAEIDTELAGMTLAARGA